MSELTTNVEQWTTHFPVRQLYDVYTNTVEERFSNFQMRSFAKSEPDMRRPLIPFDDIEDVPQWVVDMIVTPASHNRFMTDLESYEKLHKLGKWREAGGVVVYMTDHGQFTDVPVLTESLGRLYPNDRNKIVMVVSKMISTMKLGDLVIIDTLAKIANVVQTVPRLEGNPSAELLDFRDISNSEARTILDNIVSDHGTLLVLSAIGRHNQETKNKRRLQIHEPNRNTYDAFTKPEVKIVPVYMHCPTFSEDTLAPAEMSYELFEPMNIQGRKTQSVAKQLAYLFRDATRRNIGDQYPSGIYVKSWGAQMLTRARDRMIDTITNSAETRTEDY